MDRQPEYGRLTRVLHFLMAAFGVAAIVSGQFAGDYRRAAHPGFDIHQWLGLGMCASIAARLVWGFAGPAAVRFSTWLPLTPARLALAWEDVRALAAFRLPQRAGHEGLAGVVQALGLLAFLWMAASGALLFVGIEPGTRATGWLRAAKELHEGGQLAVLAYLALHVGAVLVHSLAGKPVWRRMFAPGGE